MDDMLITMLSVKTRKMDGRHINNDVMEKARKWTEDMFTMT